jgi:transcriptional regulator with XRE-family HTH domain
MKNTHQTIVMKIALNVKTFRKARGISQEEFVYFAGIDRSYYATQIERAIANTSLYVLYRIADVFEVEIKEQLI